MTMSVIERIKNLFGFGSQQSMPEDGIEEEQPILPEDEEEPVARSHSPKTPNAGLDVWGNKKCAMYVIDQKGTKPKTREDLLRELSFLKDYRYGQVDLKKAMPEVVAAKEKSELRRDDSIFDLNTGKRVS